ncbi:MAG: ABC transporter permease [Microbacteriaceae bacterium]|nr:MAG: ABC transporter permease [Microbacteriaceae bacterium]
MSETIMPSAPTTRKTGLPVKDLLSKYGTVVFLALVIIGFAAANPRFMSATNLANVLQQSAVLAILATGLTLALASGEFDLSTGSVASLAGILVTGLMANQHWGGWAAVAATVVVGIAFGVFNALLVSLLRIPSLIATLGTSAVAIGVNFAYSGGASIYGTLPTGFKMLGQGRLGLVPVSVIIAAVIVVLGYIVLEKTKAGRYMIATGTNSTAARLTGVHIKRYRGAGLVCSAALAAFAGIILASYLGTGQPSGGDSYTLVGLTVVFVGMSTIRPGQPNMLGSVIGVILLGVVANGLNLIGADTWIQQTVTGIILIIAVALAVLKEELRFF